MNNPAPFSAKLRQFKNLSRRINRLLRTGRFVHLSQKVQVKLLAKLRDLYQLLQAVYSAKSLKKILASAAVLLGIHSTADAQIFSPAVKDTFGLQPVYYWSYPNLIDLDNDGDLDLLTGEYGGSFQYFENTGTKTAPAFASPVTNPFGLTSTYELNFAAAGDLDGDGDFDIFSIDYYGISLQYFENIGSAANPAFAAPTTNPFNLSPMGYGYAPTLVDIDGDGDLDLFVGSMYGQVHFYENTGTPQAPNFAPQVVNPFNISLTTSILLTSLGFVDADSDGDYDLVNTMWNINYSTYQVNSNLFYYENTGSAQNPAFANDTTQVFANDEIVDHWAFGIAVADLDDDGDSDLLVGGYSYDYYSSYASEGNFYYFKNNEDPPPSGLKIHSKAVEVTVSPNPASDNLQIILGKLPNEKFSLELININGQMILRKDITSKTTILDVENLPAGQYFIVLRDGNVIYNREKVVIKR